MLTDRTSLQPYKKQHEQNKAIFEEQKDAYNELTGYGQVEEVQFDGRFRLVRGRGMDPGSQGVSALFFQATNMVISFLAMCLLAWPTKETYEWIYALLQGATGEYRPFTCLRPPSSPGPRDQNPG